MHSRSAFQITPASKLHGVNPSTVITVLAIILIYLCSVTHSYNMLLHDSILDERSYMLLQTIPNYISLALF